MRLFSGQVEDRLRLAEDEARMLGRTAVEPEHLLLAFCRGGRERDLLGLRGLSARDLHAVIVAADGVGDELRLGRLPRSPASRTVLEQAVEIGARRGTQALGDVELLLAVCGAQRAREVLAAVELDDFAELIEAEHPSSRPPLDDAEVRRWLVAAAMDVSARELRVPVPAFERFSSQARRAIGAAAETAARLESREVQPLHLLLGCVQVGDSLGGRVAGTLWADDALGVVEGAIEHAQRMGPPPAHQATGRFSELARRVTAEDALALAYRHGHSQVTTGHLLLAVIDAHDATTLRLTEPHTQQLARSLMRDLPGDEDPADPEDEGQWLAFDALIRHLILDFRRVLPPDWVIFGSARSDLHFKVPGLQSESDFPIRPGWITSERGSGRDRLQRVTLWMLQQLQDAITRGTGRPWPAAGDGTAAPAYARVLPDRFNSRLQLGYGDPDAPGLRLVEHDLLIHMFVNNV